MYRKSIYLVVCIFYCISLQGSEGPEIRDLLPGILDIPAVNPYLPENFVAIDYSQDSRAQHWIYWGPKEVILDYLNNPSSLKEPIIRSCIRPCVNQDNFDNVLPGKGKSSEIGYQINKLTWGDYPIIVFQGKNQKQTFFLAWLGLNNEEKQALMFELIYPSNKPNKKAIKLWDDFIKKTEPLSGYEMIKARGQDLQDGYTIFTVGDEQLKFIAEKRKSDGLLRIVIMHVKGYLHIDVEEVGECLMGLEWKFKEPMAQVYGTIIAKIAENSIIKRKQWVNILIRSVEDFSWSEDDIKAHPECGVYDVTFVKNN